MKNKPPVIYGDGKQQRSYCYASDTAYATVKALLCADANKEIFNIGNSEQKISLSELAELIIEICGKKGQIIPKYEPDFTNSDRIREREIFERYCDTSKAFKVFGYKPRVELAEGIKSVVESGVLFPKWESTDLIYTIQDEED
jgi:nucleoside-diphosphate-sugar epimerase